MSTKVVEVNTGGVCFLCWNIWNSCHYSPPESNSDCSTSVIGLEKLFRYLELNPTQLLNLLREGLRYFLVGDDIEVNANDRIEVEVSLCSKCTLVTKEFDKLFEQYDLMRQKLDGVVQSLYQTIKSGDDCPTCVDHYIKRMTPRQINEMLNAKFADSLRYETFIKCSSKLPKISDVSWSESTGNSTGETHQYVPCTDNNENDFSVKPNFSFTISSDAADVCGTPNINNCPEAGIEKTLCTKFTSVASLPECTENSPVGAVSIAGGVLPSKPVPNIFSNITSSASPVMGVLETIGGGTATSNTSADVENVVDNRDEQMKMESMEGTNTLMDESRDAAVAENCPSSPDKITHQNYPPCRAILEPEPVRCHGLIRHFFQFFVQEYIPPHLKEKCTFALCNEVLEVLLSNLHETQEGIKCPYCPNHIHTLPSLKFHIVGIHPEVLANKILSFLSCDTSQSEERQEAETGDTPMDVEETSNLSLEDSSVEMDMVSVSSKHSQIANVKLCVCCESFFPSQALLDNHMLHDPCRLNSELTDTNKCTVCGAIFASTELLKEHKRCHVQGPYKCSFCEKTFCNANDNFKEHILDYYFVVVFRKLNPPTPTQVEPNFVADDMMGKMRIPLDVEANKCLLCTREGLEYPSLESLTEHILKNHIQKLRQRIKSVIDKYEKYESLNAETGGARMDFKNTLDPSENLLVVFDWKCEFCEQSFPSMVQLEKHMRQDSCQHFYKHSKRPLFFKMTDSSVQQEANEIRVSIGLKAFDPMFALKCHILATHFISMVMSAIPRSRTELIPVVEEIMCKSHIQGKDYRCRSCALCDECEDQNIYLVKMHLRFHHFTELVQQVRAVFESKIVENDEEQHPPSLTACSSKLISASHATRPVPEPIIKPSPPADNSPPPPQLSPQAMFETVSLRECTGDIPMDLEEALGSSENSTGFLPPPPIHSTAEAPQVQVCSFCSLSFSDKNDLKRHINYSHFLQMVMTEISKTESELEPVVNQILGNGTVRMPNGYKCTHCNFQRAKPSVLKRHLRIKHFKKLVKQIRKTFEEKERDEGEVEQPAQLHREETVVLV